MTLANKFASILSMEDRYTQEEYIERLDTTIDKFRKVRDGLYQGRCPICGDSAYDLFKRRFYIILNSDDGLYSCYCHNCGYSASLKNFFKTIDNDLYNSYVSEVFKKKNDFKKKEHKDFKVKSFSIPKYPEGLIPISNLNDNHEAKMYMRKRKVPENMLKCVFWTDNYPELVHNFIGEKYDNSRLEKQGIVFVLRDLDGNITGFQLRDIFAKDKKYRFYTCSHTNEHGYFYRKINKDKPIFVVEGCIDSLFLPNSIAALTSTIWKVQIPDADCLYFNDQEPRNSEVSKQVAKCLKLGLKTILLPPEYFNNDVNDLVNLGLSLNEIDELFKNNVYQGLAGKLKYAEWKS